MHITFSNFFSLVFAASLFFLQSCSIRLQSESGESCAMVALTGAPLQRICYENQNGLAIIEGDIILGNADDLLSDSAQLTLAPTSRSAIAKAYGAQLRWPNGVIPYTLDPLFTLEKLTEIATAISHYNAFTGIRFKPRTNEPDYVTFRPADGCASGIAKKGGQQFINLGPTCHGPTIIHEMGHTIGLAHEQQREDRDSYILIKYENIKTASIGNFNRYLATFQDIGPYNFNSVMHYRPFDFSLDPKTLPTITRLDGSTTSLGMGTGLNSGDRAAIAYLYSSEFLEAPSWVAPGDLAAGALVPSGAVAEGPYNVLITFKDNSEDATGFSIQYSQSGADQWTSIHIPPVPGKTIYQYLVVGLLSETSYDFRIQALRNSNGSMLTSLVSVQTQPIPPIAPLNFNYIIGTAGNVNLKWSHDGLNLTHFLLERKLGSTDWNPLLVPIDPTLRTFIDSTDSQNTTYEYRVIAVNKTVSSPPTIPLSVYVPFIKPLAPTGLSYTQANNYISLKWSHGGLNVTHFRIERKTGTSGYLPLLNVPTGSTLRTFIDTTVVKSKFYTYRVIAVNNTVSSPASNFVTALVR